MNFRHPKAILLLIALTTTIFSTHPGETLDWPEDIAKTMWVPEGALETKRVSDLSQGVYTVISKVNLCQPAESYLRNMTNHMTSLGWKRLAYDPFTPDLKSNHARDGLWAIFYDRAERQYVMQWIDYWEDSNGNLVSYWLKYVALQREDLANACVFKAVVSYLPVEINKSQRINKK